MFTTDTGSSKHGIDLLYNPHLNKSTAHTEAERTFFGLTGLLPLELKPKLTRLSGSCSSSPRKQPTWRDTFT